MTRAWRQAADRSPTILIIVIPALLVLAAGCLFAFKFVEPRPPKRIVITTGGKSGA